MAAPGRCADGAAVSTGLAILKVSAELELSAPVADRGEDAAVAQQIRCQFFLPDDLDRAALDLVLGHETENAADMIAVKMGNDHRLDRLVGDFFKGGGGFIPGQLAAQGVDQHAGVVALDQGAVGAGIAMGGVNMAERGDDAWLLVQRHLRRELGMNGGGYRVGSIVGGHGITSMIDR